MLDLLTLQTTSTNATLITTLYTVLLAFVLSSLIAITYEKTYRGLSYSRNYVQALILSSIVAAMVMQAIGDSLARGLGMIGALAIIRFRTVFKDPRDIIFMFAALASGISCGVFGFSVGVIGTIIFCLAAFILYYSPFGQTRAFDGMLRFNIANDTSGKIDLETTLKEHCKTFALISLRDLAQGGRLEYAYHIKLKKNKQKDALVKELQNVESIKGINVLLQETTVEL